MPAPAGVTPSADIAVPRIMPAAMSTRSANESRSSGSSAPSRTRAASSSGRCPSSALIDTVGPLRPRSLEQPVRVGLGRHDAARVGDHHRAPPPAPVACRARCRARSRLHGGRHRPAHHIVDPRVDAGRAVRHARDRDRTRRLTLRDGHERRRGRDGGLERSRLACHPPAPARRAARHVLRLAGIEQDRRRSVTVAEDVIVSASDAGGLAFAARSVAVAVSVRTEPGATSREPGW